MPRAPETAPISLPRPKCCLETRLRWQLAISALEVSAQQGDELCKFQDLIGGGGGRETLWPSCPCRSRNIFLGGLPPKALSVLPDVSPHATSIVAMHSLSISLPISHGIILVSSLYSTSTKTTGTFSVLIQALSLQRQGNLN